MIKLNDFLKEALQNEFPMHSVVFPLQTWTRLHGCEKLSFERTDQLERIYSEWEVFAASLSKLIGSDERFDNIRKEIDFIRSHFVAGIVCKCTSSISSARIHIESLAAWAYGGEV